MYTCIHTHTHLEEDGARKLNERVCCIDVHGPRAAEYRAAGRGRGRPRAAVAAAISESRQLRFAQTHDDMRFQLSQRSKEFSVF